jgi:hypothetical protein
VGNYERVLTKYNWAKEHVDNLEAAIDRLREEHPDAFRRKRDDQTGEIVYYVASVPEIPDEIRLKLGDAVHNLRSTLDHLVCALVSAADPSNDCGYTSFPIFDTPEAYQTTVRSKVPSLREPLYEVFDRIQPYKDGSGHNLWKLHKLDIFDKHRLLLSVATVPIASSQTPCDESLLGPTQATVGTMEAYFVKMLFARSQFRGIPMQAGYELGRFPPTQQYENVGFAFDVAINEPEIVEGLPIFLFLRTVASEVLTIVNNFAMFL